MTRRRRPRQSGHYACRTIDGMRNALESKVVCLVVQQHTKRGVASAEQKTMAKPSCGNNRLMSPRSGYLPTR